MKIVVCDGDKNIQKTIKNYVFMCGNNCFNNQNLEMLFFSNGEEIIEYYNDGNKADLIIMEIELDKSIVRKSGIETGKKIRIKDKEVMIIFVTGRTDRAVEAFDCTAYGFVPKPIDYDKFSAAFVRAWDNYNRNHQAYIIERKGTIVNIEIGKIKYIECCHRHVFIHTQDDVYETSHSLRNIIIDLSFYGFVQTHQGFIVNMKYIRQIARQDVILDDGTKIMLSSRRRASVLAAYRHYMSTLGSYKL